MRLTTVLLVIPAHDRRHLWAGPSGVVTDAPNNFWGDALGPGPDPADQVCDQPGGVTVWQPPAPTEPCA